MLHIVITLAALHTLDHGKDACLLQRLAVVTMKSVIRLSRSIDLRRKSGPTIDRTDCRRVFYYVQDGYGLIIRNFLTADHRFAFTWFIPWLIEYAFD